MLGTILNNRYKIETKLGQGGTGTIYRAHDTTLNRDVAIKILSNSGLGTKGRARLLSEARAIAKFNHPNIITVYDVGEYHNLEGQVSPFIVMEYIQGVNLYEQSPKRIDEIIEIAKQICQALDHAHNQGIIHRDLKPENVIIEPDGNLKLMDFGLARSVATRMTKEGTIAGTVYYMAPEQAMGQDLDGRSDLYALGVMLYELTTGVLPFDAENPVAIITQHLNAPVVPPRAKRDDLPPKLNDLIVALLAKDKENRPVSAAALQSILEDPNLLESRNSSEIEFSTLDRIVRGRIVGRQQEYEQARQLWTQAVAGQGQTLLISGEPGVGKTRLIKEIITQAEVSNGHAFTGECQPEGNTPYSAFAQIVRRVLREHGNNGLEFPPAVLADLLKLSPELQPDYPDITPNPDLDPEAEQRRLFENMITFCKTISAQTPLLLVLEDVHWADSSTLAMMTQLARRTAGMPVMILCAYREVELDEALPFHQALQDLNRQNLGTRIKLERLDREQTKSLLATILAEEINDEFLDGIYQETDGNPFFIEEVCKALVESGQLIFKDSRWERPSMEELSIPQGVKVAIQSRMTKLSEETQNILLFSSVIGRVFDYPTLEKVSEKDEDSLIDCLEEALRAQLIEEIRDTGGEQFNFSHALVPFTLRESVSGLRRSRLHRKVATAIEQTAPEDYERLAHHWGEAGNDEKGLDYTIKAAERARKTYANQEAVHLYSEALALLPEDHPRRYEMLNRRAQVYAVLGDYKHKKTDAEAMLEIAEK
jgi:serine/threonine protein kinase